MSSFLFATLGREESKVLAPHKGRVKVAMILEMSRLQLAGKEMGLLTSSPRRSPNRWRYVQAAQPQT
jgi:hypothetical protein